MKRLYSFTFLIFISILLVSCGKERLDPAYKPVTFNQLRNDKPVQFSYSMETTKVKEFGISVKRVPVFGRLFQAIGVGLANTFAIKKRGKEITIPPLDVDLSGMADIDNEYINWINLEHVQLFTKDRNNKGLKFIERVEIWAELDDIDVEGGNALVQNNKGQTRLMYFDRRAHPLSCGGYCIDLRYEKINWKEILYNNPHLKLIPKITINSVPTSTIELGGKINFSVKFDVGF